MRKEVPAIPPRKKLKSKEVSKILIADLQKDYLEEKTADGRSPATIQSYQNSFKKFNEYFGEMTTEQITLSTMYEFKGHLNKERENEGLSLASANHYLREVRAFVNWLYQRGHIPQKLTISLIKGQEKPIETYSEEDVERLIRKPERGASFVEWRTWAIVCFILGTGQRIGTIVEVLVGDIHFGREEIIIRAQKNKAASVVPMDRTLANNLKKYIGMWRDDATDAEFLFCNQFGEKLTDKALQSAMWDYCRKREVEKTSPHALRHTFAKMYIMNGGDVFRLQKILNHATLEMTRHYVNLFGRDLKKGYDEFSPLNQMARKMGAKESKFKKKEG